METSTCLTASPAPSAFYILTPTPTPSFIVRCVYRSVRVSEESVLSMLSSIYTFGVLLYSHVRTPHIYVLMAQQYYCHTYCATVVMLSINT